MPLSRENTYKIWLQGEAYIDQKQNHAPLRYARDVSSAPKD